VVALEKIENLHVPMVHVDNVAAAMEAVTYLIGQGHERIAHLTGPLDEHLGAARLEGYRQALTNAGLPVDPELIVPADFSLEAGHEKTAALISRGVSFSAIFASSDQMAIGAAGALRENGLRIPEDVSLVGFDDTLIASVFYPPLTTVHQPRREIGRAAMRMMIETLDSPDPADGSIANQLFPASLVIRQSVAAQAPGGRDPKE